MAEPATVDSWVGEQKPEISSIHPLALDAIWSRISTHLSANDWLQVAQTCMLLWNFQLPQIVLTNKTPIAGVNFLLKRCQAASSITVAVEGRHPSHALAGAQEFEAMLESLQQLRDGQESIFGPYIYTACPKHQMVSLTTEHIFAMGANGCTRHPLRNLDLETDIYHLLDRIDLQVFPQLETLRLRSWSLCQGPINELDLNLSSLRSLRRLRIVNWSPKSIKVATGCRVYAVWQPPVAREGRVHKWLDSPCWRTPGTKLASLHAEHCCKLWDDAIQLPAIRAILECQHEMETLKSRPCVWAQKGCC